MKEGRCFVCQQTGHRAIECPNKKSQVHEIQTQEQQEDLGKE
jgi:hypothetical protein